MGSFSLMHQVQYAVGLGLVLGHHYFFWVHSRLEFPRDVMTHILYFRIEFARAFLACPLVLLGSCFESLQQLTKILHVRALN